MCGADDVYEEVSVSRWGSPPRVRSRRERLRAYGRLERITSACAEQTTASTIRMWINGDHLRVCGADHGKIHATIRRRGSPPRVRSRLGVTTGVVGMIGITSACAEQTTTTRVGRLPLRDHLRVCGADQAGWKVHPIEGGSPPRVRSRLQAPARALHRRRITSACAEQTFGVFSSAGASGDHLRVCGAD